MIARSLLPPGPRALPLVGSALAFRRDPLGFLARVAREHGDVAFFRIGPYRVFLLSDPDHVEDLLVTSQAQFVKGRGLERAKPALGEGLLTSEGELHRRQRRLSQPAFHRDAVASYAEAMAREAERVAARWTDGMECDVQEEMMRLTLAIAARTLFGADLEAESREIGEALGALLGFFERILSPFGRLLEALPLPGTLRFRRAILRLDRTVYRMIAERRADGRDRGDLLSRLLAAQDAEGSGGAMSDKQLRDEVFTLLLAGHETTAVALGWTWVLLSRHPEIRERLHEEVDRVLGGRLPGAEDVESLPYTRAVLAESMRLYPPVWAVGRRALADHEIGGWRLPADSMALASQWLVHRDPRHWPEPLVFDPDRFLLPERAAGRHRYAYFPFGAGRRKCIGEGFAWMEGVLVLATLARRWRVELVAGQRVLPQPRITLRPAGPVRAVLRRR